MSLFADLRQHDVEEIDAGVFLITHRQGFEKNDIPELLSIFKILIETGRVFATVHDARYMPLATAAERKQMYSYMKGNSVVFQRCLAGHHVIVRDRLSAGTVTAILWGLGIARSIRAHGSPEAAITAAKLALANFDS